MEKSQEERLQIISELWNNFLGEDNEDKKEHWTFLFLYHYQFLGRNEIAFKEASFLKAVPSQLCSYLLKLVYGIICKSIESAPVSLSDGKEQIISNKNTFTKFELEENNSNLSQMSLSAPSDLTAIISLRNFLTHGLGHHLLNFLYHSDFNLLTPQKNLCYLLINLFPNSSWNEDYYVELEVPSTLSEFMDQLYLLQMSKSFQIQQSSSSKFHLKIMKQGDTIDDFETFKSKIISSDEIGAIVIDMLQELTSDENNTILNKNSITVECLRFALTNISIPIDAFYHDNNEIIKLKLLHLIAICLNNIFSKAGNESVINFCTIIEKLVLGIKLSYTENLQQIPNYHCITIVFEILYMIFGLLNNILAISNSKLEQFQSVLKCFDEETIGKAVRILNRLLIDYKPEQSMFYKSILKILFKIIENLKSSLNKLNKRTKRKKIKKFKQLIKSNQLHCQKNQLPCLVQGIILKLFKHLPMDMQKLVLRYFVSHSICCCLYNIEIFDTFLNGNFDLTIQKSLYKFLTRQILTSIYVRNYCNICEIKSKSSELQEEIFQFYKNKYKMITDRLELAVYLKHLLKISYLLKFDILGRVLVEIVLPVFRNEKQLNFETSKDYTILLECLNIFINYLHDIRLIKAFFVKENLDHLKDLLHKKELTRAVCDLIRIGADNGSFLGDNNNEQQTINECLCNIELESSNNVTHYIYQYLKRLSAIEKSELDLKINTVNNLDSQGNRLEKFELSESFYIASIQWGLNFELFKTNQQFRVEFLKMYSTDFEEADSSTHTNNKATKISLFKFCYDLLSCFLYYHENHLNNNKTKEPNNLLENIPLFSSSIHNPSSQMSVPMFRDISQSEVFKFISYDDNHYVAVPIMNSIHRNSYSEILPSFHDVTNSYDLTNNFLEKLKLNNNDFIFDIQNQSKLKSFEFISNDIEIIKPEENETKNVILPKIFNIFGFLFQNMASSVILRNVIGSQQSMPNEIDDELLCLCTNTDCKQYLLKTFESTMAIFITNNIDKSVNKMQLALRQLKSLILNSSERNSKNSDSTNAIIQALHSLLKVAEISNRSDSSEDVRRLLTMQSRDLAEDTVLNTSIESEIEYYSTKASCSHLESEIEFSENETEEFYLTADEGYLADGEIQEISEKDEDIQNEWNPFAPVSRYRTNIMHNGICRVVVEILIELSSKCVKNSQRWANLLSQLANRLFLIRESLGGPLFLLKGFTPILKSDDSKLKDFQQNILDLIGEINTPELLQAYFKILASDHPPINILISNLTNTTLLCLRLQPKVEITFPIRTADSSMSSCNPLIFEQIDQIKNYHSYHNVESPFTKSACILPINHTKIFNNDGFTLSTWLLVKKTPSFSINSSQQARDDINPKTHLVSIGSSQLVISIYITNNLNLLFETIKPNAEIKDKSNDISGYQTSPSTSKRSKTDNQQDFNNKESITANDDFQQSRSPFKNALKHTKLAILNSFSQMLSSATDHENSFEGSTVELKYFRLQKSKWTHLSFAVDIKTDCFEITAIVDGSEMFLFSLPCANLKKITANEKFQAVLLGEHDETIKSGTSDSLLSNIGLNGCHFEYSLSNILLFQKSINCKNIIRNLTALGPDCLNFTQCQVGNIKPNCGFLNFKNTQGFNDVYNDSINLFNENLSFCYSACDPTTAIEYSTCLENEKCSGVQTGSINFGILQRTEIKSIQTAVILSGGISALLYVFARAVELSTNTTTQSQALDLLLGVCLSDTQLYTEFVKKDFLSLIGSVIKTDQCGKDINILKVIVNRACGAVIISFKNYQVQVDETTTACVKYPNLIISVIKRYSDWHRNGSKKSEVLDILLKSILALVRDKHPHKTYNFEQLLHSGLIKALLNLTKVYIVEAPNPIFISISAAESFVSILSIFAGSPPLPSLMDEIMKLLLLLHKPSECFVTHDRLKFYFLISPDPPTKQKLLSLPMPTGQLRHIMRERKKAIPKLNRPSPFRQTQSKDRLFGDGDKRKLSISRSSIERKNDNFKRVLSDYESLELIANCSKIKKKDLKLCTPTKVAEWRVTKMKNSRRTTSNFAKNKIHKINRRSIRLSSKSNTDSEGEKTTPKVVRTFSFGTEQDIEAIASQEYDVVDSDELSGLGETSISPKKKNFKNIPRIDYYNSVGIIKLQEKLYRLLGDFLLILPDSAVEEVINHYVKIDILLVLASHQNTTIRASILRLISALCERMSPSDLHSYTKKCYWHHLANQMSIHSVDNNLFQICTQWITGTFKSLEEIFLQKDVEIINRIGLNTLFAFVSQTIQNQELTAMALYILRNMYLTNIDKRQIILECGLIEATIKTLYKFLIKHEAKNTIVEMSIVDLLTAIGEISVKSDGQIHILWEIINLLSFYQEPNFDNVLRGIRLVQSELLKNILNLFFGNNVQDYNLKDLYLTDSTLTISEIRTRFKILYDRISVFFITANSKIPPTDSEIKLFELMVVIGINGNIKCNSFLAWGLLPSSPMKLRRCYVNLLLTSCRKNQDISSIVCDWKMIKSFLWHSLIEETKNEDNSTKQSDLKELCSLLNITISDSSLNLENELEKLESIREKCLSKYRPGIDKSVHRFESIAQSCIDSSMIVTRIVAELQVCLNSERKILMNQIKEYSENHTHQEWISIIERMTHEGAPWYFETNYPRSWELDPTEGPSRVHTRLRRCQLDLDSRFIMEEYQQSIQMKTRPLEFLLSHSNQQIDVLLNSQVLYNYPAKYMPMDGEIDGEILVTDHKLYFLATHHCKYFNVVCEINSITEIWIKRYQHKEKAFEIFLDSNKSLFFALSNEDDWKNMKEIFHDKIIQLPDQSKITVITQQWREGLLTNWEYLMTLNQISGRTYNDLMQYPVFPWILSNYTSNVLDITDKSNFRKFEKPIAVQHEENEEHYISNYNYIESTMTTIGSLQLKPYHYSSHYSNSGTVLHFLVRVPPFTNYFLKYQDNNFDIPDRTFHSIDTTWRLASKDSTTDVKELIPEFFCLPEMFENYEGFDFGLRQTGEPVKNVLLPPWCLKDPRLFIFIHRQALESEFVRTNLHHWIDLIFGYKQTGQNAVNAINVFHPATYSEFLNIEITDSIEKKAFETMIKTYGQMPKQLFKTSHPVTKALDYCLGKMDILPTVKGLRWGVFTGSPQLSQPTLSNSYKLTGMVNLVAFQNTNVIYLLPSKSCVMQGPETDIHNMISWNYNDRLVRIQPLGDFNTKPKCILYNDPFDEINCCGSDVNSNSLWFGHKSGRISVYRCIGNDLNNFAKSRQNYMRGIKLSYNSAFRKISPKSNFKYDDNEGSTSSKRNSTDFGHLNWYGPTLLLRHTDEITCISISMEFKIVVSAGKDGLAVIWDLNDLTYIRTIQRPSEIHHSPINLVTISPTLGDIVTVHSINYPANEKTPAVSDECFEVTEENLDDFINVSVNPNGKSIMRLHSVNARYINHIIHEEKILTISYSYIKEGVGINVIAAGIEGGIVRLWSSWNLNFVREIVAGGSEIRSLIYSTYQHLIVLTEDDLIQVWESEGLYGNPPKFPQIVYK